MSGPCQLGHMVPYSEVFEEADLAYDANDLSPKLEGFRPGACGHGSCLVPVT